MPCFAAIDVVRFVREERVFLGKQAILATAPCTSARTRWRELVGANPLARTRWHRPAKMTADVTFGIRHEDGHGPWPVADGSQIPSNFWYSNPVKLPQPLPPGRLVVRQLAGLVLPQKVTGPLLRGARRAKPRNLRGTVSAREPFHNRLVCSHRDPNPPAPSYARSWKVYRARFLPAAELSCGLARYNRWGLYHKQEGPAAGKNRVDPAEHDRRVGQPSGPQLNQPLQSR